MFIPMMLGLVSGLTCIPLISAFYARSLGKNFFAWYFIGMLLPLISVFILILMDKREPEQTDNKNNR